MSSESMQLLISGDYHIYGRFDKLMKDFPDHTVFGDSFSKLVKKYPNSIVNLEDPVTESRKGCIKSGPYGVGSEIAIEKIKKMNFRYATFATNHTYDMKNKGIRDTIDICASHGIKVIGAGISREEARKFLLIEENGITVSILNYAREEFNLATSYHGGANRLDTIDNVYDIIKAKALSDFVVLIIHDGVDVFSLPYPSQVKQMHFFADMGADAIIVHHSQSISGFELYKNTPIFYGLGNLMHWTARPQDHEGLLVSLSFKKSSTVKYEIIPIKLDPIKACVDISTDEEMEKIMSKVTDLSRIIADSVKLQEHWESFVNSKKTSYLSIMGLKSTTVYRVVRKLGLSGIYAKMLMLQRQRYLRVWNIVRCESHRQAFMNIMNNLFEDRDS